MKKLMLTFYVQVCFGRYIFPVYQPAWKLFVASAVPVAAVSAVVVSLVVASVLFDAQLPSVVASPKPVDVGALWLSAIEQPERSMKIYNVGGCAVILVNRIVLLRILKITYVSCVRHYYGGKKGDLVMRFMGNLTIWREILTFALRKYMRNGGKYDYIPKKFFFSGPGHYYLLSI